MSNKLCCGYSLRGGVKVIGLSDIAVEIGVIILEIFSIIPHVKMLECIRKRKCYEHVNEKLTEIGIVTLDSASILIHIIELLIVIVVYQGAQQRNMPKCKIWVRITEVLTSLDGIIFIFHMILEFDWLLFAFIIPDLIYKIYSCTVVESFITEMRSYNGIPPKAVVGESSSQDAFD